MATYLQEVSATHKKFREQVKKAKTRTAFNKAYSTHKKAHDKILKKHLAEEQKMIKAAKDKLE